MLLSLSIPSYTLPSVQLSNQIMDATTTQNETNTLPSQDLAKSYPLSTIATPPSVKCSAFSSCIPNLLEDPLTKDCYMSLSNPPRKRSATYADFDLPLYSSHKRARTKFNSDSTTGPHGNTVACFDSKDNISFPSPSPTPTSQHPIESFKSYQQQCHQKQRQKQKQKQKLQDNQLQHQSVLSLSPNIDNPSLLNALWDMPNLINTFDTLPTNTKNYLIFQLLKRSSRSTLKFVNSTIVPVIKRDILASLPHELALQVIQHLDARSLCRATTVSKTWRSIVDNDALTWQSLIYKEQLDDNEETGPLAPMEEDGSVDNSIDDNGGNNDDGDNNNDGGNSSSNNNNDNSNNNAGNSSSNNNNDNNNNNNNAGDDDDNHDHSGYKSNDSIDTDDDGTDDDDADVNDDNNKYGSNIINKNKKRPLSPISNAHRDDYRKRHILRDNWRRGRFKRISFPGHSNGPTPSVVTSLQFDDDKIISGVDDRVINIYETKTGKLISTLRGHEGGVWALQYIGNTLVSGSTDRTVRIWDIEREECTHVFLGHTSTVRCLQIVMPTMVDGRLEPATPLIVTGSRDSTLRVWRLPDPRTDPPFGGDGVNPWHMHTLRGHSQSVRAITAHGDTLVSGSYDATVNVWNLETGRLVHRMEGHTQKVYAVVIDPERKRCLSGSMDGSIRVWDYISGHCLQILEGHTILVGLLGLSKNHLVSAAADGTLRTWNPENGVCEHVLSGHDAAITCFQHDEHKVVSGAEGGLKLWDAHTGRLIADLITGVSGVWRTAFDKNRCVAAVYKDDVTSFEVLDFSQGGAEDLDGEQSL